jgi:hypothetical protein
MRRSHEPDLFIALFDYPEIRSAAVGMSFTLRAHFGSSGGIRARRTSIPQGSAKTARSAVPAAVFCQAGRFLRTIL